MSALDLDRVPFFDGFLSYASADQGLVEPIAQRLADDRLDIFFDSWFIQAGQSIPRVLLAALRKSHKVVVFMTPNYFRSKWAEFELNWNFFETHLAQGSAPAPVVPVLLQACDVPKELSTLKRIDLTEARAEAGFLALAAALAPPSFTVQSHVVPPGPPSRHLGDFVGAKLSRLCGFPPRRAHEVIVVYGELVHNAFAHVSASDNRVEVSVRADPNQVLLEVSDSGGGVDLAAHIGAATAVTTPDENPPSLGGLRLAAALCEQLSNEMRDGRHVIRAVLQRERTLTLGSLADLPTGAAPAVWAWLAQRSDTQACFEDPAGRYVYLVFTRPRIDHDTAEAFRAFLQPYAAVGPGRKLVIDVCDVAYMSSAGIRALMLTFLEARATGGTIELVCGPVIGEIMEISRLTSLMRVFRSRSEAARALAE
jgi:anti-anti-sigma factor